MPSPTLLDIADFKQTPLGTDLVFWRAHYSSPSSSVLTDAVHWRNPLFDRALGTERPEDVIAVDSNVQMCHAPDNAGKCGDCRACWDKDVDVVGYRWH